MTVVGDIQEGLTGYYDYSPHGVVDTTAQTETDYWCGDSPSHIGDTILEMQHHLYSWTVTVPETIAFDEGPVGSWDYEYTCNPSNVVRGSFPNVLGDGVTYNYVIYYTGQGDGTYAVNQIGAAFSTDGLHWHKYPTPVEPYPNPSCGCYGYGQPSVQNINGTLTLFFEESNPNAVHHFATSTDGVHFSTTETISNSNLVRASLANNPANEPYWGAVSYNPTDNRWYGLYNDGWRPTSMTGGVQERGDFGCTLFSTDNLVTGSWTELGTYDTNLTGYENNFMCGFVTDTQGQIVQGLFGPNAIKLMVSTSVPRPAWNAVQPAIANTATFNNWQLAWHLWEPGSPLHKLVRVLHYVSAQHEVTTGWYDSSYYTAESNNLGSLYEAPTGNAALALYGCKAFGTDYFISADSNCEGQYKLGLEGYAYSLPGIGELALYRCFVANVGHFVSTDPLCEGQITEGLLGYSQA